MVKNMKTKTGVNGVACWWKFNHDCQALTGQRIQALANAICKPHRVKKYSEVVVAIEKWERDISRFEAATGKNEIIAVAQGEGSEGTSNGWTWPEEGCTGAARQGKGPGDGHFATSGTSSLHFADDITEDAGKLADKLEEIMSFVSNLKGKGEDGKSKGNGKGGKRDVQSWHCGKIGHVAAECWQKDAEMEQYRASKGKGKAKGSSKGEWEDPSKGSWSKSSWKGKGNPWVSRKGTYWFDQTNCSSCMLVDQPIKENEAMMQVSEMLARSGNAVMNALCLTTAPGREESVNMVQGWRREEEGWVRVRSVMDSGCGVSVAPPGMCPTYLITESEGSRRGQEFMSASEDTMPNLEEQKLGVVLDSGGETMIKYQIADVSRALNSIAEICDAGHPDFGTM